MSEWTSVEARPGQTAVDNYRGQNNGEYPEFIVMIEGAKVPTVLYFTGEYWVDDGGIPYSVTHWMPLPEPPEDNA